jgi:hypothetical protein
MPLLDLRTNLKSLKYGNDQPGYGSSGLPYVQFPLPENASGDVLEFYRNNRDNLDFPIRGGGFNLGDIGPYVSQAAKYDKIRIQKFLKDPARGTIFILKQQALQLSNPKIQVGSQINLDLGVLPFRFVGNLENTRIYNGGKNTLAQVGVQGSGIHFDRHGMVPINPYQQTYIYVANDNNNQLTNNGIPAGNRLYTLYKTKILSQDRIRLDTQDVSIATLNTLGISRNPDLLLQYPGGPTSVGGIGLTTVHRRVNSVVDGFSVVDRGKLDNTAGSYLQVAESGSRTLRAYEKGIIGDLSQPPFYWQFHAGKYNIGNTTDDYKRFPEYNTVDSTSTSTQGTDVGTTNIRNLSYTFNYNQLQAGVDGTKIGIPDIKADFRKTIVDGSAAAAQVLPSTAGYEFDNNITAKYGIGNPGTRNLKRVRYNESVDLNGAAIDITQDKVNMLDIGQTLDANKAEVKDLIKFRFDTMEVDSESTVVGAGGTTALVFRAFLSGLQDNHTAEYTPFRYTGRGENFYTYTGFTREISFNFKIAAQSRPEMRILYRKLNYLASQLYPDYQQFVGGASTGFMRAPLIKLTIGDYITYQPGFLKNLNLTVPDDASWEIANNQISGADDDMYQLPQLLEASCQFTPIHDFLPRRSWITANGEKHIVPLITPNEGNGTGNNFGIGIL